MSIFLKTLAQKVLSNYKTQLGDLHVILPSTRATLYFKHYLHQLTNETIFIPYTLTLDAFIKKLSHIESLNQPQLLFKLYNTFRRFDQSENHTFENFLPLGNTILSEFSLIDRNLTLEEAASLFDYWLDLSRMKAWGIDVEQFEHDTHLKNHLIFCENLKKTYFALRDNLLKEKKGYSGLIYRVVADNIERYIAVQPIKQVVFAGFNQIYPAEDRIIQAFIDKNQGHVYWDIDAYYMEDKSQEAGTYFHTYLKKYNPNTRLSDINFLQNNILTRKKNIRIIKTTTKVGQTVVANHFLQKHIRGRKKEPNYDFRTVNDMVILLADESLLLPLVNNLDTQNEDFDFAEDINITMGASLKHTQIFGLFQIIFELQDHYKKEDDLILFYYPYVYQLLKHPLIKGETKWVTFITNFIQKYQKQNTLYFAEVLLQTEFQNFSTLASIFRYWKKPEDVFSSVKKLLLDLSKSRHIKNSNLETSSFYQTYLILQQLENIQRQVPDFFTIKVVQYFLNHSLSEASIPFTSLPLQPIQIMGTLESRALDFKKVILLSCNENVLPRGKNLNHLIPFEIRQKYKLPTYIDNDSNFAYTFYRLFHHAEELTLIHVESKDKEKSRFLLQVEQELAEHKTIKVETQYYQQPLPSIKHHELKIKKDPAILDSLKTFLKTDLSPTAIIMYLNDSIEFFNRYILNIREDVETMESIDHRIFGIIIHGVLHEIYRKGTIVKYQTLEPFNLTAIENLLSAYVDKEYGNQVAKSSVNYIFLDIAKYMIHDFINFEKRNILPCQILKAEDFLRTQLNFEGIPVCLSGKVDRIDLCENQIRVIDYKTGQGAEKFKAKDQKELLTDPNKSKIIQLMLYKYLFLKNVETFNLPLPLKNYNLVSGFYFLRQLNIHIKNKNISTYQVDDQPLDHKDFIEYVEMFLNQVVKDMLNEGKMLGE